MPLRLPTLCFPCERLATKSVSFIGYLGVPFVKWTETVCMPKKFVIYSTASISCPDSLIALLLVLLYLETKISPCSPGFSLKSLLPQPLECWDDWHTPGVYDHFNPIKCVLMPSFWEGNLCLRLQSLHRGLQISLNLSKITRFCFNFFFLLSLISALPALSL